MVLADELRDRHARLENEQSHDGSLVTGQRKNNNYVKSNDIQLFSGRITTRI